MEKVIKQIGWITVIGLFLALNSLMVPAVLAQMGEVPEHISVLSRVGFIIGAIAVAVGLGVRLGAAYAGRKEL